MKLSLPSVFPRFISNSLAVGYIKANELVLFDKETTKTLNILKYTGGMESTTNKVVSFPGFLATAHEDKYVRIFDNQKMTNSFVAHTDSVSSLCILPNGV